MFILHLLYLIRYQVLNFVYFGFHFILVFFCLVDSEYPQVLSLLILNTASLPFLFNFALLAVLSDLERSYLFGRVIISWADFATPGLDRVESY